ncbi:AT-hook motif nuclear-localized protein [Vigna angularis]|uniref:AT-hook motif nuclear-localized protein n=1 Tax=Phaseolus angularis TaxID=3914 RepID=A0A8T0JIB5_PHAAN|nr:AT-hook motif nuclear-localized protein [Vigna angularis]
MVYGDNGYALYASKTLYKRSGKMHHSDPPLCGTRRSTNNTRSEIASAGGVRSSPVGWRLVVGLGLRGGRRDGLGLQGGRRDGLGLRGGRQPWLSEALKEMWRRRSNGVVATERRSDGVVAKQQREEEEELALEPLILPSEPGVPISLPSFDLLKLMNILSLNDALKNLYRFSFVLVAFSSATLEDIVAKLFSFSQQRPRALCSLTRTGIVSSITLRQLASTSISVSYEARLGGH